MAKKLVQFACVATLAIFATPLSAQYVSNPDNWPTCQLNRAPIARGTKYTPKSVAIFTTTGGPVAMSEAGTAATGPGRYIRWLPCRLASTDSVYWLNGLTMDVASNQQFVAIGWHVPNRPEARPGIDGKAGRGVAYSRIIGDSLWETYTDSTRANLGRVVGHDGYTPRKGVDYGDGNKGERGARGSVWPAVGVAGVLGATAIALALRSRGSDDKKAATPEPSKLCDTQGALNRGQPLPCQMPGVKSDSATLRCTSTVPGVCPNTMVIPMGVGLRNVGLIAQPVTNFVPAATGTRPTVNLNVHQKSVTVGWVFRF